MDFGKKIMEKYGYKEGTGLGKNSSGIVVPIKANFKFDTAGLGEEIAKSDHWWERVYNEASSNLHVEKKDNDVAVNIIDKDGVEITNKSYSLKKLKESKTEFTYGSFLKSATLLANVGKEEEIKGHVSAVDIEIKPTQILSDEALFKACGGRTAHKGARHGLKLTGKLNRLEEQDRILMEKMKMSSDKAAIFKDSRHSNKNPNRNSLNSSQESIEKDDLKSILDQETDYVMKKSKKKKKREKQSASILSEKMERSLSVSEKGEESSSLHEIGIIKHKNDEPKKISKKSKKKRKRSFTEINETMEAEKCNQTAMDTKLGEIQCVKKIKIKLHSDTSSMSEVDILDSINKEEPKKLKKSKTKKHKHKKSVKHLSQLLEGAI